MSEHEDDAVDTLLLAQFEGPVPDDGFCDDVMQVLPARRRRHTWPLAVGLTVGAALCWLSLLSVPLVHIGARDWLAGHLSAPAITLLLAMASISLLTLVWSVAETGDGRTQE